MRRSDLLKRPVRDIELRGGRGVSDLVAKMEATILVGLPLVLVARRFFSHPSGHIVGREAEA